MRYDISEAGCWRLQSEDGGLKCGWKLEVGLQATSEDGGYKFGQYKWIYNLCKVGDTISVSKFFMNLGLNRAIEADFFGQINCRRVLVI